MSWLQTAITGGLAKLLDSGKDLVDEFQLSGEEAQQFKQRLTEIAQQQESEIEQTIRQQLQAKERVLVAELKQDDAYTKRARPTVIYAGLVFVALNYVLLPLVSSAQLTLPPEFWYGWSGIVGTYAIGRSMEKRGARSKLINAVTGGKDQPSLLD